METSHLAKSLKLITFYGNSLIPAIDEVSSSCYLFAAVFSINEKFSSE